MTGSIQGSASTIGMAPTGMGSGGSSVLTPLGDAGASSGETALPTAGTADVSGGATADPAAAPAAGAATPLVPSSMLPTALTYGGLFGMAGGAAGFAIGSNKVAKAGTDAAVRTLTQRLAQSGVMAAGADVAATAGAKALGKGPTWMKWGGAALAAAGLGAFALGKSAGNAQKVEQGKVDAIAEYNAQLEPALQQVQAQHQAELAEMQAQIGGGATDPAATGADPAATAGSEAEAAAAAAASSTEAAPIVQLPAVAGAAAGTAAGTTGVAGTTGAAATGATGAAGAALVGSTIDLAAGVGSTGTQVAEAGTYAIAQDLGTFATLAEANAAVRATMDPEAMGTRFLRYAVVQSGTSFHAVVAQALEGGQPKPLTAAQGQVVAWNALGHVSDANGNSGWQAYSWDAQGGASSIAVPYGSKPFPSGVGAATTGTAPAGTTGTAPAGTTGTATTGATTGAAPVAGGGAVAPTATGGVAFDPASALGRTFAANASTTAEGTIVAGGAIQLQGFVASSTGGFGTADQAAVAARQARTSLPANPYSRVVTMQGSDGRYYVYQASVVARETAPLQNAAPMHVFGSGFASYYDGATAAWQSLADR